MSHMNYRKLIKKLRVEAGITQAELAENMGLTNQSISNYESGRKPITKQFLLALENVLGVDIL